MLALMWVTSTNLDSWDDVPRFLCFIAGATVYFGLMWFLFITAVLLSMKPLDRRNPKGDD